MGTTETSFRDLTIGEIRKLIEEGHPVVDVRDTWEWQRGHIPGARHVPLAQIIGQPGSQRFEDGTIFQCEVGERSAVASHMAVALGVKDVVNFRGGMKAWREAGLPVEKP